MADQNKQIEEMANDIAMMCPNLSEDCCGDINCVFCLAKGLIKQGYRKEIRGEWKKPSRYSEPICTICKKSPCQYFGMLPPFCPHCGAKMKGVE